MSESRTLGRGFSWIALVVVVAILAPASAATGAQSVGGPDPPSPAAATILTTSPADGEINVSLGAPIVVTFSEPVNIANVSWVISPDITLLPSWTNGDTVLSLLHANLFTACTLYTVEIVGYPSRVPNPWSFMTACANPFITSTYPANGAVVPPSANIVVAFSEPMDTANVTWTLTPLFSLNDSWNTFDTILTLSHSQPFPECIAITITVYGLDLDGNPLVAGPVPNPWTFTTSCIVTLLAPVGGEVWTGGSVHPIEWNQNLPSGGAANWSLYWSMDGGATWAWIANGTAQNGKVSYEWTVPVVDISNARVRVCVEAGAPPPTCDTSAPFAIDSTAPALVSHDPPDGATDVPLVSTVTATFSEAMGMASVEASFWITPTVYVVGVAWPDPTTVIFQIEVFQGATTYVWGFSCGARDKSDPGNPLANCQESHTFTTLGGTGGPPSIALVAPLGGESWTGGTSHPIEFVAVNPGSTARTFNVTATYRYAGGTQGGTIGFASLSVPAGGSMAPQIPWTTPLVDVADVVANLTSEVADGGTVTIWAESGAFEIDSTPPAVISVDPAIIFPWDPIVVTFSEPMAQGPTQGAISLAPSVGGLTFSWVGNALTIGHADFVCGVTYTFAIGTGARDDSDPGNPLSPGPYAFSFLPACPPSVDLVAPDGGEDWTGGSDHTIQWTSTDTDDATLAATLSYSIDGGADGFPYVIADGLAVGVGGASHDWTLPEIDSEGVLVRIRVEDSAGNVATDTSAAVFTIDSTPPALLVSYPGHGSSGHKTTRDVWFVWTEPVDRASFLAALAIVPDPGGLGYAWAQSNLGGDVLLVSHAPLRSQTEYEITFGGSAKDDSDPGNPLASAVTVRFTTQPPPAKDPPVALAVGQHQVAAGEPTTFDGSGSTGEIVEYAWRIVDNQGRFVGVLVGERATFAFPQHGRYSVTLIVTDVRGATDEDTLEIVATSSPNGGDIAFAAAAGGALLAAVLIGATEVGKLLAFQLLLIPLYARLRKDELLEQEKRGMIRGYILVHPGDSYSDIRRNLNLPNGTLSYHLAILEREKIIHSQARGARRLYFPSEARVPEDGGGMHEVQIRMLRAVQAIPGLAVTDLAGALGISSQLALYHLRNLAAAGAIRFERRGLRLRCYPVDSADAPKI